MLVVRNVRDEPLAIETSNCCTCGTSESLGPEGINSGLFSRHSGRLDRRGSVTVTFYEVADSIANGLNCICCFVREFTMEFLFECQ